jgi:hypothetical protein
MSGTQALPVAHGGPEVVSRPVRNSWRCAVAAVCADIGRLAVRLGRRTREHFPMSRLSPLSPGFEVALGWLCGSFGVALGWLWGAYRLAINTLCGRFRVAWCGCTWGLQIADGKWPIARPIALLGFSFQLSAFQLLPDCGFGWLVLSAIVWRWLGRAVQGSRFRVQGSGFKVPCPP